MNLAQETFGFRREGFSPSLSLLMPAYSLQYTPYVLTVILQGVQNAPLPPLESRKILSVHSFGNMLSPVEFSAQTDWISELLRFL